MHPFISICIPAYKNKAFLERLLASIAIQTYHSFEVIVSDDSPDDELKKLCEQYEQQYNIMYYKNEPAYGMPANWNAAINKAQGEWIKIMHDDDWFATPDALQQFADATGRGCRFIFSAYNNIFSDKKNIDKTFFPTHRKKRLLKQPLILLARNIIGPPSVCMVHKSLKCRYDVRFRWFVDIEYYIQCLKKEKTLYCINSPLINIGINNNQITNDVKNNPKVEFSEAFMLLSIYGTDVLSNVIVFDAWWRMCRNMHVNSIDQLATFANVDVKHIPQPIKNIINKQKDFSEKKLFFGPYSKLMMLLTYLKG